VLGTLFVAERAGTQAFGFRLRAHDDTLEAVLEQAYYPMRRFGGKALVGAGGRAWYDFPDGWAPLVRQPRSRYLRSATLLTPVLDGREPGCVWHRLVLDACLPPGTAVAISSVAADEPEHLAGSTWRREPTPVARPGGPELPFATAGAGIWTSYELLLQRARGRYLQLRLELTGNQSTSPRLRALRVHYPRFSYLERYLPGVYREDAGSASFLDRFLANLEGVSTEIEDRVAAAQVLFDPAATPAKALEWLAGWFGVVLDPRWDEPTRRLFIANAMEFFRHRGTVRGVELALRLALGPADQQTFANPEDGVDLRTVRIVETFKTRRAPGVVFGDPTDLAGPRLAAREPRWRPAQGGEELSRRYRARLDLAGIQVPAGTPFPVSDPGGADAPVWRAFADEVLGFVPDAGPTAARLWPGFLARRYSTVGALNLAHGETLQRFQDATPPARLPADGPALADWFTLQSVVLPMHRKAHRFTVLLPVRTRAGGLASVELRELARRVVALQKPAQTLFDVRFFWSAFRVGEARLGRSTVIESGSRAPELFAPAVLGREYLGEARLGGPSNLAYQEAP
jgi:phage tail-like protein